MEFHMLPISWRLHYMNKEYRRLTKPTLYQFYRRTTKRGSKRMHWLWLIVQPDESEIKQQKINVYWLYTIHTSASLWVSTPQANRGHMTVQLLCTEWSPCVAFIFMDFDVRHCSKIPSACHCNLWKPRTQPRMHGRSFRFLLCLSLHLPSFGFVCFPRFLTWKICSYVRDVSVDGSEKIAPNKNYSYEAKQQQKTASWSEKNWFDSHQNWRYCVANLIKCTQT